MSVKISHIIDYLNDREIEFRYHGDANLEIDGFCSLNKIKHNSIVWIKDYTSFDLFSIDKTWNLLVVANLDSASAPENYNIISCERPRRVFFSILSHFFCTPISFGIAPTSIVETDRIGKNVSIGHYCHIGRDVVIGDNVIIKNNVQIECRASIGNNTIINSGVVIGTDGFGYSRNEDGTFEKIPHYGGVIIGERVEIGANTCIDRGTIDDTTIENGVKIDNLCHIAHNVHIKENAMLIALCMIAGSSVLGKNSYIAPGASIMNHIHIGDNAVIGIGAIVTKSVEPNKVVVSAPARVIRENTDGNLFP